MIGVGQLLSEDGVSFGGDDNVLGLDGAMVYIMLRILSNTTELFTLWVFCLFCFGAELKPRVSRI